MTVRQSMEHFGGRNASMAMRAPWLMAASMSRKAAGLPEHFERRRRSLRHAESLLMRGLCADRLPRGYRPSFFASSRR